MKKTLLFISTICFLTACTSDTKNTESDSELNEKTTVIDNVKPETLADVPWAAVLDSSSQKITMTATPGIKDEDLNLSNVTESLNRKYPEVMLSNPTQKNDTVFVKINDADYLTQGSGSMGAEIYLAEATYSFTQIPGVNFVNFDFKEGDHASPGTFGRTDFKFSK